MPIPTQCKGIDFGDGMSRPSLRPPSHSPLFPVSSKTTFLGEEKISHEDLLPRFSRSGATVVNPEPDEKSFLALNHFFTPFRVVGSLRMGVRVGVVGGLALDWGEGSEKQSVDDEETFAIMEGACGTLNLARRRVSEA